MKITAMVKRTLRKAFGLSRVTSPMWSWYGGSFDYHTGDWQKGVAPESKETLLTNSSIYACVTGIANDISKLRIKLTENEDGIWEEVDSNSPFLPVLRKPNRYQNRIKFVEQWILSKLLNGNTYVLKERDARGIVNAMYVLNPMRVTPLVATDGGVYYQLNQDYLAGVEEQTVLPASEIIHDTMCCLWHPLIGVPPLYACALAGSLGKKIQTDSSVFFANRSLPGGVLHAPGKISQETAERLKKLFEENYGGANVGRLLVVGDGLEFQPMRMTSEQSQLAEQLQLTVEDIARAFHYPLFKLGGPLPPYAGNTEALIISYYTDCLQSLIESVELCLDEGLALPKGFGTELDLDNLMRMDTASLYKSNNDAVGGGWMAPNEARYRANFAKVEGGESPMIQQQNYSLAALAKRDAQADPFGTNKPEPEPSPPQLPEATNPDPEKSLTRDEMEMLFEAECRLYFPEISRQHRTSGPEITFSPTINLPAIELRQNPPIVHFYAAEHNPPQVKVENRIEIPPAPARSITRSVERDAKGQILSIKETENV
jgi:HK97 family phage portal protein